MVTLFNSISISNHGSYQIGFLILLVWSSMAARVINSTKCDQHCGAGSIDPRVPYPFGFSEGCVIRLNCTEITGDIKIGEYNIQNVTSDALMVNFPVNCSRPIEDLQQFVGTNYGMTWRNGLLLQNCKVPRSKCTIPSGLLSSHFNVQSCNSTKKETVSCYSEANTDYLDYRNTGCGIVLSSIFSSPIILQVDTMELAWGLEGDCACHDDANCTHVFLPGIRKGFRCRCKDGFVGDGFLDGNGCRKATKRKSKHILIAAVISSIGGIAMLVGLLLYLRTKCSLILWETKGENYRNVKAFLKNHGSLAPRKYSYSEVKKMTEYFKNELGQGGYGCVYKGKLQNGSLVAVKVLKESKGGGEEFINEVASISRTSHINIVSLVGFCFEGKHRALIYDFMPNGSLEKFIYDAKSGTNRQLGWQTLYAISLGIARGLEYLHRGCNTRILHFDIKPHNILLDEDFCPKISDFGLAKLCNNKESIVSLVGARGTIGYIAPEIVYKNIAGVSHKSDVYSFGMMVLEMVGGRKNVDVVDDHTSEIYFPHWIYKQIEQKKELGLTGIVEEEDKELAEKMVLVSLWCIQTDPSSRPSVSMVVEMLQGELGSLQMPPKPFLYSSSVSDTDMPTTTYMI